MTELAQFRRARGNFDQDAARACNGALQEFYKHPWGSQSNASPILLLPRLVGKLFEDDGVAHGHDLMGLFAMQTLAVGSQLAFFSGLSAPGLLVVSARFPGPIAHRSGIPGRQPPSLVGCWPCVAPGERT